MTRPAELPTAWRALAAEFRALAAEGQACALERCASQLEAALAETADELLTLEAAALESGYTVRALRHLLAKGDLPNVGKKGSPRVRRADLPVRPGGGRRLTPQPPQGATPNAGATGGFDPDAFARKLASGGRRSA